MKGEVRSSFAIHFFDGSDKRDIPFVVWYHTTNNAKSVKNVV